MYILIISASRFPESTKDAYYVYTQRAKRKEKDEGGEGSGVAQCEGSHGGEN